MNDARNIIATWYSNQASFVSDESYRNLVTVVEDVLAARDARIVKLHEQVVELEAKLGPKPWCPDCGHSFLAYHSIIGCQHLTPVYNDRRLMHHDKCRCKTAPPEKT